MMLTRDKLAQHNKHFADHGQYALDRIHAFVQEQCLLHDPNEPAVPHNPGPLTRIHLAKQRPKKCRSEGDKVTIESGDEECIQRYPAPTAACHMLEKFTSPNVQVNRLTMRTRRRGLFNYGKSSAKAKTRRKPGVQDLVFSETAFLGHRQPHPSKSVSKRLNKKPASSYMSFEASSSKLYYMNSSHGKVEHEGNNTNSIRSMHKEIHGNQQHEQPSYSFGKTPVHYYHVEGGDDDDDELHGNYDGGMMESHPYQLYAAAAAAAPMVPDRDAQEQQNYEEYMQYYYYVDQHPNYYDAYEHQALPEPYDPADLQYAYYDNDAQDGYYYPTYYYSETHPYQQQSYDHAYYGDGEQGNYAQAQQQQQQQQQPAVEERWMPHAYTLVTLNDIPLVPQQQQQPHPGLRPVRLPTPLLPPTPKPTPQGHEKSPIDDVQTLSTGMSLSDKQDPVDKTIAFLQASTKKALQPDFSSLWKQRPLHR